MKIYCAGPLFNEKEREDMQDIAVTLENNGFEVFLPHRDGIELARISEILTKRGFSFDEANVILTRAIFCIDTYQISDSDGLILNMNGRVPDEGAMVEAGIAWTLGKPIVIYKNDARSLLLGQDNPLVVGLSKFKIINSLSEIPVEFDRIFTTWNRPDNGYHDGFKKVIDRGKSVYDICSRIGIDLDNSTKLRDLVLQAD